MATRTWSSAASTDMNDTANYSGAGSFATDDLVFDNTSVVNAAATAAISCNSITITSGYSGTWALTGYTATCAQGFSDDGITGAHNYGNGITCGGASATFHVGSGVGTITATSCAVTMNGTTAMVIDDDKGITLKSLTLGASALVTNSGGATTTCSDSSTPLVLGASATLTLTRQLTLTISGSVDAFTLGASASIAGTTIFQIQPSNSSTVTIPAITRTGAIYILPTGNSTTTLSGNLSCGNLRIYTSVLTCTFNQNGKSITASELRLGVSGAGTFTFNLDSTLSVTSYDGSIYNSGTVSINMSTSSWTCTGAWSHGSTHTVDEGTSSVTFSGTGATNTVTSAGKMFYDVTLNKTSTAGVTFADATNLHALTVSGTNTQAITWAGTTMTASGNITIDGSGTLHVGNGITMSGASATLHFGSTLGTVTGTSCTITMNGSTGMIIDDDKGSGYKNLILGASAIVTSSGTASSSFAGSSVVPFVMGNNSTFTQNAGILSIRRSTTNGDMYTIGSGCTFNGTGAIQLRPSNISVTLPAFNYTGSGTISLYEITTGSTHTLTGNFSTTGALNIYGNTAGQTTNFNQDAFAISCTTFITGANNATATFVGNYSNNITCSSFTILATGAQTINMDDSVVSVAGSITIPATGTFSPGTSSFTVTNTATITSNAKSFANFVINAAAKTITLADALTLTGNFTMTAGTLAGAFTTTCAGNVTASVSMMFNRLIMTKATTRTITIGAGQTLTLTNLTDTNLNGTAGALTQWRSSTTGVQANLTIPAPITLTYQNPQDNAVSQVVTATTGGVNGGNNNANWIFPAATSGSNAQKISRSRIAISMGI